MKVLVTGANGFIGNACVSSLAAVGHEVVAVVRCNPNAPGEVAIGEIGANTAWNGVVEGCDAVVHLAAISACDESNGRACYDVNVNGALNLASQAAAADVRRFVFLSSLKVHGENSYFPIQENSPFRPENTYASSKHQAEIGLQAIALETGMEVVIIRPPVVYGPGMKGNFSALVRMAKMGIPLPFGAVCNSRSLLALENLIDFVGLCVNPERSPKAANEAFLVSDGLDVSTPELLRSIARAYGRDAKLLSVPTGLLRHLARLLLKDGKIERLMDSLQLDSSKAKNLLGWEPVVSLEKQLRLMARHDQNS